MNEMKKGQDYSRGKKLLKATEPDHWSTRLSSTYSVNTPVQSSTWSWSPENPAATRHERLSESVEGLAKVGLKPRCLDTGYLREDSD